MKDFKIIITTTKNGMTGRIIIPEDKMIISNLFKDVSNYNYADKVNRMTEFLLDKMEEHCEKQTDENKDYQFEIGENVICVDADETYCYDKDFLKSVNKDELISHFVSGSSPENGMKLTVVARGTNQVRLVNVYVVQNPLTTQVFVMEERGLLKI